MLCLHSDVGLALMTGPRDVTLYFGRVRVMKMCGHGRTTLYKRPIPMADFEG
jgi:hypothetical protein